MEEAPLQFIETWDFWAQIAAAGFIGIAVLRILMHFVKLAMTKDFKVRYDYINENEIKTLWTGTVLILIGVSLIANSFLTEIGLFWFIIRWFSTFCIAFILGIVANNMYKFYYPFYIEKRLRLLRYKPRISPKTGKEMKLLSEEEEDVYLDEGMQAEEDVYSIDYDVWVDEESGYTKIEKYSGHLHALKCPECSYQTLRIIKEKLVTKPTYTEEGELTKYFSCSYCDHKAQETVTVGKLVAAPNPEAAPA